MPPHMLPPSQLEKIRAAYNIPAESSHIIYDSPDGGGSRG